MYADDIDLEWTDKPFSEVFIDLIALRQLFSVELPKTQKNALLKSMQERCVASLEALSNNLISHLPHNTYPEELKSFLIRQLTPLKEKFSILAKLRGKTVSPVFIKTLEGFCSGRNEKIAHPKVKKYPYQILSNEEHVVTFKTDQKDMALIDPDQMITDLVKFIDQFFFDICQVPEIEVQQYLLDQAVLPDGKVGLFLNMDLKKSGEFIESQLKLSPRFLVFLKDSGVKR